MKSKKLSRDFFNRRTLTVAKELLGKFLIRKIPRKPFGNTQGHRGNIISAMITETEAYCGPHDLASHAHKGRTKRTEVMFGPPGHAYVYLIYGMYNCLNIVTEEKNYPAAILIRGVKAEVNLSGPGKVCRHFNIDRELNGEDVTRSSKLWLEDPKPKQSLVRGKQVWAWSKLPRSKIKSGKRIGIDYAGEYKDKLWRFFLNK